MQTNIETAVQTATSINNTFWIDSVKKAIYGFYLWSYFPTPNNPIPYQMTIKSFVPSNTFYATTQQYRGGVDMMGNVIMSNWTDQNTGKLINANTIMWADGSVWSKTTIQPTDEINQYNPVSSYNQAAFQSDVFNHRYNATYPPLSRYIPYGNSL